MTAGAGADLSFSPDDVSGFAAWSADRNPLHVDPAFARQTHFGQQVVHGVLTVLKSLGAVAGQAPGAARTLDIEFRDAVLIGPAYRVAAAAQASGLGITLRSGEQLVLDIRAGFEPPAPPADLDLSWVPAASAGVRETPALRPLDELQNGLAVTGDYPDAGGSGYPSAAVAPTAASVLALCSYVTGMEMPGLKSLFTRITIAFHGDAPAGAALRYRARAVRFDRQFRLLDTELVVATAGGGLVATALLRATCRSARRRPDLEDLAARLVARHAGVSPARWRSCSAAAAGLAPTSASALALAGCRVYVSARQDDETRRALHAALASRGARVEFLAGDAGDPEWCAATLDAIRAARRPARPRSCSTRARRRRCERIGRESAGTARALRPRQPAPRRDAARACFAPALGR